MSEATAVVTRTCGDFSQHGAHLYDQRFEPGGRTLLSWEVCGGVTGPTAREVLANCLYRLAADLMRAPMDERSTEGILRVTDTGATLALAETYYYSDSGWKGEGHTPLTYLLRHVLRSLGVSQVDLAVTARRLAEGI